MIDVRRLQLLQTLEQHQTVAATAEALHVTPSAVSQQLTSLAKETGVTLVERSGRRFVLTGAARVLLGHANAIFAEMERARADLASYSDGDLGSVRLGSFATGISGLVAPAVAGLRRSHPGWRISVTQAEPEHSTDLLRNGDIDLAVTHPSAYMPYSEHPDFQVDSLMVEPLDAVLPYDHPLATAGDVDLAEDLADEDWIISAPGTVWYDLVASACGQAGYQPRVAHAVDEMGAAFSLVTAGLGIALMPRLAWSTHATPHVVVRSVRGGPRRHIMAVMRRGSNPEPMLAALREAANKVPVPSSNGFAVPPSSTAA